MKFNGKDVLREAQNLIIKNQMGRDNCSEHCPWCAISNAKSVLDERHGVEIPLLEVAMQVIKDEIVELPEDAPLVEARVAIKPYIKIYEQISSLSKEESLKVLREAEQSL